MPTVTEATLFFRSAELPEDTFFLCTMQGREALSQLYEFHIMVSTEMPLDQGDIDKLMQHPAEIWLVPTADHKVLGVVRAVEVIPQLENSRMRYLLTLVPRLWYLTQTRRSRVFQNLSAPDIVSAVLKDAGLEDGTDFAATLTGSHPVREFTVQYEETDFQFVSRLLEYEGMFYFFDHTGTVEKLVIGDANGACSAVPGLENLVYAPVSGVADTQSVMSIRELQQTVPRQSWQRDYNFLLPSTGIMNSAKAPVDEAGWPGDRVGHGYQIAFGENVMTEGDAVRVAKLRAEEHLARKVIYEGRSSVAGLHPGYTFTLEQHHMDAFNCERLITEMFHEADQEAILAGQHVDGGDASPDGTTGTVGYHNDFEAIKVAVVFRPARLTPRPRIDGVIHAVIDGDKPNQMAHIDDKGRYRVVMPYDIYAEVEAAKASLLIRFAQSYAGPGYGIHFPLHQGTEVLLAHIDGDPDRPVIVGAVPNPNTVSPVVSPDKTVSKILTRSKILIRFDDDA